MVVDVDEAQVRRLEAGAAAAEQATVGELRRLDGACSARAVRFGDGALIAMGASRYVNRAVGVSVTGLDSADVDQIELFFAQHGASAAIELSAWAPAETVSLLRARGYGPDWFRSMYARPLDGSLALSDDNVRIEPVDERTRAAWLDVLAGGNEIVDPVRRATSDEFAMANSSVPNSVHLVAWVGDQPVGCASIQMVDGVAWLGGTATLPAWRGRGIQSALVRHRLRLAVELGAALAAATAVPAGTSARNLHRADFVHVQTQVVVSAPGFSHPS